MPSVSTTTTSCAPGLDRRLVRAADELEVGAGRVDAEERDADALARRRTRPRADALEHRLAGDAERRELPVRDRALDHRRLQAELDERLHVGLHRAREAPDLGVEPGVEDERDRPRVVRGHAREARPRSDRCRPPTSALAISSFCSGDKHDADRLLAVAQRRVVEADRDARLRLERLRVEVAGPDLRAVERHARTIPSGNGESFSAPPAVIRKLSSTRRPPPPSQ